MPVRVLLDAGAPPRGGAGGRRGARPAGPGPLLHEVLRGLLRRVAGARHGAITAANLDEARALFAAVVEARLAALPESDAAVQRTRLLGSPVRRGSATSSWRPRRSATAGCRSSNGCSSSARRRDEAALGRHDADGPAGGQGGSHRPARGRHLPRLSTTSCRVRRTGSTSLSCRPMRQPRASGWRDRAGGSWRAAEAAYIAFGKGAHYEPLAPTTQDWTPRWRRARRVWCGRSTASSAGEFPPAPAERVPVHVLPVLRACAGRTTSMTSDLRLPFDDATLPPPGDAAALRDAAGAAVMRWTRRRNVVLEASAGTGKTRVLVDRYVNLLRRRRRSPEHPGDDVHAQGGRRDARAHRRRAAGGAPTCRPPTPRAGASCATG